MNAKEDFTLQDLKGIVKDISYERSEEIMTIAERLRHEGIHQGLLEGIEGMLDIKFGGPGLSLMNRIKKLSDIKKLEEIKELLRKAKSIDEVQKKLVN